MPIHVLFSIYNLLQTKRVVNQPYDETLDVNDEEEVASTFTPSPRPELSRGAGMF